MRIFVTGATGFIGSAVVEELIKAGHFVRGLSRSTTASARLVAAGAEPYPGTLEEPDSIAAACDGVDGAIHLGFNHDFSRFVENCENDRRVITALGTALAGSGRPLIVTSVTGIAVLEPGRPQMERDRVKSSQSSPRSASEEAAAAVAANGTHVAVVRLPQVHDTRRCGLVDYILEAVRSKGVFPYVGEGCNRWPAVHVSDAARLFRLAIETSRPGATYHCIAESGVRMRDISETVAQRLGLEARSVTQDEATELLGWLAHFLAMDNVVSSDQTRRELDWHPTGPSILEDLRHLMVANA